jgi:hypothetical protein
VASGPALPGAVRTVEQPSFAATVEMGAASRAEKSRTVEPFW